MVVGLELKMVSYKPQQALYLGMKQADIHKHTNTYTMRCNLFVFLCSECLSFPGFICRKNVGEVQVGVLLIVLLSLVMWLQNPFIVITTKKIIYLLISAGS